MRQDIENTNRRLSSPAMCARFGITPRTLSTWTKDPSVGLPPAIMIRNRGYWPLDAIIAWEKAHTATPVERAA